MTPRDIVEGQVEVECNLDPFIWNFQSLISLTLTSHEAGPVYGQRGSGHCVCVVGDVRVVFIGPGHS